MPAHLIRLLSKRLDFLHKITSIKRPDRFSKPVRSAYQSGLLICQVRLVFMEKKNDFSFDRLIEGLFFFRSEFLLEALQAMVEFRFQQHGFCGGEGSCIDDFERFESPPDRLVKIHSVVLVERLMLTRN
jgi:hypothetical protein